MPQAKGTPASTAPARTQQDDHELLPYVLSAQIGTGSFATVYKGHHEASREQVAVKVVSRSILTTKLFENLQSEIEILKRLHHHHVTQLIDIIRAEKNIYLIMEYCSGGDLSMYIKRRGKIEGLSYVPAPGEAPIYYPHPRSGGLDEVVARAFLRQLARALKFLRFHNLIHRDIKPQNLLLTPPLEDDLARGHPIGVPLLKLADFGFARVLPNATLAETLCGSPLYMAPEILRYEKYDAKADLWSVGAVLYETCVGGPPFRAQNHIELLKRIERARSTVKFPDEEPGYSSENKSVPSDIKDLIRALLKRHPVDRMNYEEFFKSKALELSKFKRPEKRRTMRMSDEDVGGKQRDPWIFDPSKGIPETHKYIPPEVLDPKANVPPSTFHFRRNERKHRISVERASPERPSITSPPATGTPKSTAPKRGSPLSKPLELYESPRAVPKELPLKEVSEPDEDPYIVVDNSKSVEFSRTLDEIQTNSAKNQLQSGTSPRKNGFQRHVRAESAPFPPSRSPPKQPLSAYPPRAERTQATAEFTPGLPTTSRSASGALTRALNMATKKLFGDSSPPPGQASSPLRRESGVSKHMPERDAEEDALLAQLEDLAQKTHVILRWCDDMYEKLSSQPSMARGSFRRTPSWQKNRGEPDPDCNPVVLVQLYLLLMSFSQRGIDSVKAWQGYLRSLEPLDEVLLGEGFDEALVWFRDLFFKSQGRIFSVKQSLPSEFGQESLSVQLLIYNHATQMSRIAARKELLDQMTSPDECEQRYEDALWCLYVVRDDITQEGVSSREENENMVEYEIKRTKLRLHRCRLRMQMEDRERLQDARADHNLDDVQRYPPPWEL